MHGEVGAAMTIPLGGPHRQSDIRVGIRRQSSPRSFGAFIPGLLGCVSIASGRSPHL